MVVLETLLVLPAVKAGVEAAGMLVAGGTAYGVHKSRARKKQLAEAEEKAKADAEAKREEETLSIDTPVDTGLSDDIECWLPGVLDFYFVYHMIC